ncbi:hypothetical protein KAT63_04160 [Candidatus Parcubacteria bacterium]|nr:hypothetical protein [Candidatus Parcubacteria bacterium]
MRFKLYSLERICRFITSRQKLFCLILIFIVSIFAFPVYVYAAGAFTFLDKPVVEIVNDFIKLILSFLGRVSLLVLILGGVFYVVSGSNPEKQEKAKKTIIFALLGLMLVLASHAIIVILDKMFVQT